MTNYESMKKWARICYIARKIRSDREVDYPNFNTDEKAILIRNLCWFATEMNMVCAQRVFRDLV